MAFNVGEISATVSANMKPLEKAVDRARSIGTKMAASISLPLAAIGGAALKTAADYESLRVSMDTLNGSAEEGARNFERLKQFSAETPFQLQDLAKAQNTLQGFSLDADTAFDSIQNIGDIAAVTGGDIQAIATAFGQSAAEGKLFTRDIRQFINQGVPAVQLLADSMGVAQNQVFDLAEQGKISFNDLQNAFRQATSEGGMFANGMQKQSQTLSGVFSTLKDNVSLALGELGSTLNETFNITGLVKRVTSGIKNIVEQFKGLSDSTKTTIFAIAGILGAAGPIMVAISAMIPAISAIGAAFAALVSPIGLAVGAVAGLAAGVVYLWDNWKAVKERISDWSWWRNMLVDMGQFLIEYSPISLMIKQLNAALSFFGQSTIPNPFEAMAAKLEGLKTDTKEYEHEFGSFMGAVNNAIAAVTGINLSTVFNPDPVKAAASAVSTVTQNSRNATNELIRMQNWFLALDNTVTNFKPKVEESGKSATLIGEQLGSAFARALVFSEKLSDSIKNIAKQLASKAIVNFVGALLSGGLGGIFSGGFGKGIGKLIGVNDALIRSDGSIVKFHPNDNLLAMQDFGNLSPQGAGVSSVSMERAFKRALDQKLTELSPESVWVMGQKGRRNF